MLVDDSIVVRSIIERIVTSTGEFEVPFSVPTAAEALDILSREQVDIIVLDIEMPGMNGLAALPLLLQRRSDAKVIVLSASCDDGGPAAVEALARGACDTLVKPGRTMFAGTFGSTLIDRLRAIASRPMASGIPETTAPAPVRNLVDRPRPLDFTNRSVGVIGIGASTGGIMAINAFVGVLPATVNCPILITQHLPPNFIPYFAEQTRRASGRPVHVAENAQSLEPGHIYVAPGETSIGLVKVHSGVRITLVPGVGPVGTCPSVDTMLSNMADVYAASACAVVLSGMGKDGLAGAGDIRRANGLLLAQDMESSTVWGMPGAVATAGLADIVLNPIALATELSRAFCAAASAA